MTEDFKVLNDYQHNRLKTEMYLGSRVAKTIKVPVIVDKKLEFKNLTYVPAILTCFREALDNSLNELSFVGSGEIKVVYKEENCEFSISDNGRGIPLDINEDEGLPIAI